MPHGVLFRGGDEAEIRKQLIEKNNIETVIGLPANIFYGTGIPTIILVLKKHRETSDVLFIDASKEYYKDGSKNKLLGCNIKKITDAVLAREDIEHFAKLVSKDEIIKQEYNLNIPRYISSDIPELPSDINAVVMGNIPNYEVDNLNNYWEKFSTVKDELFEKINEHLCKLKVESVADTIKANEEVKAFENSFSAKFLELKNYLKGLLIDNPVENPYALKPIITEKLFETCSEFVLVDKYEVYKAFDEIWDSVLIDLNTIKEEGIQACRETEDIKTYDKKTGEIEDKQKVNGKVMSFDLIAQELFTEDYANLSRLSDELDGAVSEFDSYWDEMEEEFKSELKKKSKKNEDEECKIDSTKLKEKKNEVYEALESEEIKKYNEYFALSNNDKIEFEKKHHELSWPSEDKRTAKGVFNQSDFKNIILEVKDNMELDENDDDYKIRKLFLLNAQISSLKTQKNKFKKDLEAKAVEKLGVLTDEEIKQLLQAKWILPIMDNINKIPFSIISDLILKVKGIIEKYNNPLQMLDSEISATEKEVKGLLKELAGNEFDMQGIRTFMSLLGGDDNE